MLQSQHTKSNGKTSGATEVLRGEIPRTFSLPRVLDALLHRFRCKVPHRRFIFRMHRASFLDCLRGKTVKDAERLLLPADPPTMRTTCGRRIFDSRPQSHQKIRRAPSPNLLRRWIFRASVRPSQRCGHHDQTLVTKVPFFPLSLLLQCPT